MKLSLQLLYEQLQAPDISLFMEDAPGPFFSGIRILRDLSSEHLAEDILYVDLHGCLAKNGNEIKGGELPVSLVSVRHTGTTEIKNGLCLPPDRDIFQIFNELLQIFERFQGWSSQVRSLFLKGADLQQIFDCCRMVTPDTVYLTDTSMKLYVHSQPTLLNEISAIWRYQVAYGYMPIHIMNHLITEGEMEEINRHHHAFTTQTSTFNNPYVCRNIICEKTIRARIFIVCMYSLPLQTHKEIADELGDILQPYVQNNVQFSAKAGGIYENFFLDLLKRRIQSQILVQQQISIFNWETEDRYSVLVIDAKNQEDDRIRFLIHYLSDNDMDSKAFEYEEQIVCLFHVVSDKNKRKFSERVEALLQKMELKGAFSKNFTPITDLDIYYMQAAEMLKFCIRKQEKRALFFQENMGLYGILGACLENHNVAELGHPSVIALYAFDQKNGTQYLETLYQYLLCGGNAVKAARALYIHRNTMNYRLQKMQEMFSFDSQDEQQKLFLLLSILLLKYQIDESLTADPDKEKRATKRNGRS